MTRSTNLNCFSVTPKIRSLISRSTYVEETQAGSKRWLGVALLIIELARFGKEAEFIRGNVVSHSLIAAHLLDAVHLFRPASIIAENRPLSKQPGRRSVRMIFVKILVLVHLFRTNLIHLPVDE
jgi:hypothetical protein